MEYSESSVRISSGEFPYVRCRKLHELTDEELAQVSGGSIPHIPGLPIGQVKGDWDFKEYEIFLTDYNDKN